MQLECQVEGFVQYGNDVNLDAFNPPRQRLIGQFSDTLIVYRYQFNFEALLCYTNYKINMNLKYCYIINKGNMHEKI